MRQRGERERHRGRKAQIKEENIFYKIRQWPARADVGNDGMSMRWAGVTAWAGWADFYKKKIKVF
jgi:hypothetical protein